MKTITDISRMTFDELQVYLKELLEERTSVSIHYNNIVIQIDRVLWSQKEKISK